MANESHPPPPEGPVGRPETGPEEAKSRGGCLLSLFVGAAFFFLLRDFTATPVAVVLALVGGTLTRAGIYLTLGGLRYVLEGPWYAALVPIGLLLLAGAAGTLAPAAPAELLTQNGLGWELLERRLVRLEAAIEAGDTRVAGKLAGRGLGDPAALDRGGTPLLHHARDVEMVAALLEGGLDPDAAGARGQTLLMRTDDPEVVRLLLAAGADPEVRSDNGFTALMFQGDDRHEIAGILLEAGADVHAVTDSGRTVADLVTGPTRAALERYAGGRPLRETGGVAPRGREDWLVPRPANLGSEDQSGISRAGDPLRPGDVGGLVIVLDNPTAESRVLEVRAVLQGGLLFLGASHQGVVEVRGRPGLTSTVRWPWLSLPPGARGHLEVQVLAQPDDVVADVVAGDLHADVRVVDLPERTEQVLGFRQERAGPAARVQPGDPGGALPFFLPAGIAVLVVVLFWLVVGRRRGGERGATQQVRIARVVLFGCVVLCVGLSGTILWSMIEPQVRFEEASCRILDHRVVVSEVTSTRSVRQVSTPGQPTTTLQAHPIAAVEIDTGTERLFAAGWATGLATRSANESRHLSLGSTVPCWVDPDRPRRFTLVRTPSMAGVIGLALVLGLTPILFLLAWRVGRRVDPVED